MQFESHPPQLRELESPSLVPYLLLENPWILAGLLIVAAGAAFVVLNNRRRARAALATGGLLALLGVGVIALAMLVTTDREQVGSSTRELIHAIARAEPGPVDRLLSEIATLAIEGALRDEFDKEQIIGLVRDAAARDGVYDAGGANVAAVEHRIREVRIGLESDVIARSQVNVVVTPSITNIPTGTWWELDWDKHPDGAWRVRRIELVWVAGVRSIGPR